MTSPSLNITVNNATYQLYQQYSNQGLIFRHIDVEELFKETPLYELHKHNEFMPKVMQIQNEHITKDLIKSVHYRYDSFVRKRVLAKYQSQSKVMLVLYF